ncbi:MAG: hypothetical protein MSC31_17790 [Solirubrobacteraceae bacterium MAG38_C4-C5]|nr:hypothetical protein [Candidatus Siliceabacter maunaloa]
MREHRRLACWALALNGAWEVAQLPLNTCPPTPRTVLRAALGDALLTVAVAVPAAWTGRRSPAVLVAGLAGAALGIERNALARGRWAYRPAMPTARGVGLVPLVQLPLLGLTAAGLVRRRARR